jgi:hypothetical protein
MRNAIDRNEHLELSWDESTLTLSLWWLPSTSNMTPEQFRESMLLYAKRAEVCGARRLLVDTRQFGHTMSPDTEAWRREHVVPRYNKGGARRFAFVLPAGAELPPAVPAGDGKDYETRFFDALEDAHAWLAPGHVVLQYTVKPEVDVEEVKAGVRRFVGEIRASELRIGYRSMQLDERRFVHVITVDDAETQAALEAKPWFKDFGPWLRARCAEGPTASRPKLVVQTY